VNESPLALILFSETEVPTSSWMFFTWSNSSADGAQSPIGGDTKPYFQDCGSGYELSRFRCCIK
jgi:hypothetical protein